ncbi:MAG: carbohydrate binding family 9 domain-containing protein [Gemmatimonadales bacterium]|nr:carbohydrate binding family 9 domain-containing protein [Gemmatimonadales bacterium]
MHLPSLAGLTALLQFATATAQAPGGGTAPGTSPTAKEFTAVRFTPSATVVVDGRLDDNAWRAAQWRSDFRQKEPVEGGEPSGRTEVAFAYDDHALYVGARMYSRDPRHIPTAVTRRDQMSNAEHLVIVLDTYHDRRTAYSFSISSGGVRSDYYHPSDNENSRDFTWDPVWEARTSLDSLGWMAEVRIPFSQLRFTSGGAQQWGVQINRWIPNTNEDVYWIVIPKQETGWSSRFGLLTGIEGVQPSRRIELVPYVASNGTFATTQPGDPFRSSADLSVRAGADLKMGLGPNLTLDATVNPDFGQVEADPAEVNLSAFETFQDERRPFFTEGAQLLRGGQSYFYSRRIGQAPRGPASGDFVDRPSSATILGAAKVTGRRRSGLSIGALTAFTGQERARVFDATSGTISRTAIEPFTAYGVGRVQQEFGASSSIVGATLTTVQRSLSEPALAAILPATAITGGGDVNLRFNGGQYEIAAFGGFSYLRGDPAAILRIQQAPAHFMQRPDATEFRLDSTRSAFAGWTSGIRAARNSGRHWVGNVGVSLESPTFDLNDLGRLGSANDIDITGQVRYRETTPSRFFHQWSTAAFLGRSWNFGGVHVATNWSLANNFTFRNYWNVFLGTTGSARALSDDLSRGGPLMGRPGGYGLDAQLSGNGGRPTTWRTAVNYSNDDAGGSSVSLNGGISARPAPQWRVSIDPGWRREVTSRQYVTARPDGPATTYGTRYVFAYVDRTTLSARMRINYAFTPDLSVELYAEPFAASGHFHDFGELPEPRSHSLRFYGTDGTTVTAQPDGSQTVTADGQTFTLASRDFSVLSFRSNLVVRWEWLRGSTLFIVWQQDRSGPAAAERGVGVRSLFDTFGADGRNFLAVKATYWLAAH